MENLLGKCLCKAYYEINWTLAIYLSDASYGIHRLEKEPRILEVETPKTEADIWLEVYLFQE